MEWLRILINLLWLLTSVFMILLVLIQRGKGGGLAGAFGAAGGSSAFGTRAGDVFTKITVGVFVVWLLLGVSLIPLSQKKSIYVSGSQADQPVDVKSPTTPSLGEGLGTDVAPPSPGSLALPGDGAPPTVPAPPTLPADAAKGITPETKSASKPEATKDAPAKSAVPTKDAPAPAKDAVAPPKAEAPKAKTP